MIIYQIANQFSFLVLPIMLLAGVAALLAWRRARWPFWLAWAGLAALFAVFLLTSGQRSSARYDTPEQIRQTLATAGQPTLVEFFSNY